MPAFGGPDEDDSRPPLGACAALQAVGELPDLGRRRVDRPGENPSLQRLDVGLVGEVEVGFEVGEDVGESVAESTDGSGETSGELPERRVELRGALGLDHA